MLDVSIAPHRIAQSVAEPASSEASSRRPPTAVKCILPVWGYKFIRQFLDFGLPTLLAPGNVPALAATLPCEFILLTSYEDEAFLRSSFGVQKLSAICPTEIRVIDHLITGSNYSTTITLAYVECVRAVGEAMLDTCFFFLVSDYIVANGSFKNALDRVMRGASGVLVGNFQVALEEAMPWLREQVLAAPSSLALQPRELMRWGLSHLHPATIANMVNYPLNHNLHTNRLFWRADGETLVGRFYLMHMLCIRPEKTDFIIGSSCDYSFIPEMCPSDNVEIICDSDEYLVIEMQPRGHEVKFLKPGQLKPRALARTLSEWTTARHRENSNHSVVFHCGDLAKDRLEQTEKVIGTFLAEVRQTLKPTPMPHRRGAMAAFREAHGARLSVEEWRSVLGLPDPARSGGWINKWLVEKIRFLLYGRPPNVRRWHPRWPDYQGVLERLQGFFEDPRQRLLMMSDVPTIFTASFADGGERAIRMQQTQFLGARAEIFAAMSGQFDVCLLELSEGDLERSDELIDRVAPMLKPGGKIIVAVYNRRIDEVEDFIASVSFHSSRLLRPSASPTDVRFVIASWFRWNVLTSMMRSARLANRNPLIGIPMLALRGTYLSLACGFANLLVRRRETGAFSRGTIATSVLIELAVDAHSCKDAYKYSASRIVRQQDRRRHGIPVDLPRPEMMWAAPWPHARMDATSAADLFKEKTAAPSGLVTVHPLGADVVRNSPAGTGPVPLASGPRDAAVESMARAPRADLARSEPADPSPTPSAAGLRGAARTFPDMMIDGVLGAMDEGTREPQYNRCLELRDQFGLTSLGLMTNQVFYDDPRRLAILLSRYKFVAKMLSGKHFVAEVGCGDAFGTRIVSQEVGKVVAYDFDPVFIDDIRQRQSDRWPIEALLHNIVTEILPEKHDAIYSLDVIEHIDRMDEHAYLSNLRGSLTQDGVLIIGTPSLESQAYASPPSKAGHVNCKRGPELKILLQQYFANVFVFSMNDEVVHTGFYPMAHYLFAICCGSK